MKKLFAYAAPFLLIIITWFTYPYWMLKLKSVPIISDASLGLAGFGAYGDAFGALNALFAGLAFSGIIVSIFLQSKELSETRGELRGQKDQMRRQVFENTFFQILRTAREAIDTTYHKTGAVMGAKGMTSNTYEGRECINFLNNTLKNYYLSEVAYKGNNPLERYEKFYSEIGHKSLGHYYRLLYSAIKYVHENEFLDKEENENFPKREFYVNLIRAQVSSDELFLLFYNCLSVHGKEKFKPMVEKYSFFEHLQIQKAIVDECVIKYSDLAFGDNEDWKIRIQKIRDEKQTNK